MKIQYTEITSEIPDLKHLKIYKEKGLTCARCGLKATHWITEQIPAGDGVNFKYLTKPWAYTRLNGWVLITIDHIIPKSKKGNNFKSNLQTMCAKCNTKKGNRGEGEDILAYLNSRLIKAKRLLQGLKHAPSGI